MRTAKRTEIEWAFMAKVDGCMREVDTFNLNNCHWTEPIEEWGKSIMSGYIFDHTKRKWGKSLKLVKRTTTIETIWRNGQ